MRGTKVNRFYGTPSRASSEGGPRGQSTRRPRRRQGHGVLVQVRLFGLVLLPDVEIPRLLELLELVVEDVHLRSRGDGFRRRLVDVLLVDLLDVYD